MPVHAPAMSTIVPLDRLLGPVADSEQGPDRVPVQPGGEDRGTELLLLAGLLQESGPGVEMLEHDQDVLAEAQRVLHEVGTVSQ